MQASIGNQLIPGWPQAMHVQPAASDASKCWLSGPALQAFFTLQSTYDQSFQALNNKRSI